MVSRRNVLQTALAAATVTGHALVAKAVARAKAITTTRQDSAQHGQYTKTSVRFPSDGVELVGNLYIPNRPGKAPAVVMLGPFCYVKEQAPIQYATRLADEGFVTLAFDCRNHGASAGQPRRFEQPLLKVSDLRHALDFLAKHPQVDSANLVALGVCEGASEVFYAAAQEARIKAVALVSGHYRDRDNDVELIGGEELLQKKITRADAESRLLEREKRAAAALAKFEKTGVVDYAPIVDPVRKDVALPWKMIWDWYHGWADRGIWENRYAVMSDVAYLKFESLNSAAQIKAPLLMIHGEFSDGPASAHRHFDAVVAQKKLIWENGVNHFQYYEDPEVIDRAVGHIAAWYRHPA